MVIVTEASRGIGRGINMFRAIPLGRLGTPEDVAYSVMFLASKEENYITGLSIIIDGGQTLPETHYAEY